MQAEDIKIHVFISRMKFLFNHFARNFLKKSYLDSISIKNLNLYDNDNILDLHNVYCGTECEIFIESNSFTEEEVNDFKTNAITYYRIFCKTLREKIDFENFVLNSIPAFNPKHVIAGETNNLTKLILNLFPECETGNVEKINEEYRSLADYPELKKFENYSITDFWAEIGCIKNSCEEPMFSNIYRIAKGILSIPHSSANVERIFSIQNLIKTKCRNRLAIDTVSALIQSKDLLRTNEECCHNYNVPKRLLNKNIPKTLEENEDEFIN